MPLGFFGGGPIFGPWIARRKAQSFTPSATGEKTEGKGKKKKPEPVEKLGKKQLEEQRHIRAGELEYSGLLRKELYRERLFAKKLFAFFALACVATGILAASIRPVDPQTAASRSMLTFLTVIFFFLLVNFSILSIRVTFNDVVVRFGMFNFQANWADVTDAYVVRAKDGAKNLYGIRMQNLPGGYWRIIYSAGLPRVVLRLKEGAIRELAFTTMEPEKVLTFAAECMRRKRAAAEKAGEAPFQ
ncbi:MAG: hypothetical protein PWR02_270 [Synergistales bacterium]|nr:hypothetical protein [Synergistales bacterium]